MSALGQKQTSEHFCAMSALPPKADIGESDWHVRFVPKADICSAAILPLFDHQLGVAKQRKRHGKAEGLGDFQVVETWL